LELVLLVFHKRRADEFAPETTQRLLHMEVEQEYAKETNHLAAVVVVRWCWEG